MSLDGLRAWIGEVERKLGMRTRVFLVLVAIAIGGAGAAIYLAIEAENNSVSRDDLQAVEERVEAAGGGASAASLQTQITQLQSEISALRAESAAGKPEVTPEIEAKPPKKEPEEAEGEK
jgi:HAMP domain-containing protein